MYKSSKFHHKSDKTLAGSLLFLLLLLGGLLFLTACNIQFTKTAEDNQTVAGVIKVQSGMTLERDIIPQICQVFSLSEQEVKDKLAATGSSKLITTKVHDFRRMEGIIVPGEYVIMESSTLEEILSDWVAASEIRYNELIAANTNLNQLTAAEQVVLGSMIEAECQAGTHQEEVATVFLKRLADGSKLQCCLATEYALGYQRPYLTYDDIAIKSEYNTYYISGLPVGPICTVSDTSLRAAISNKMDSDIYFFYYDYVLKDMFFFSDYAKFSEACTASQESFEENFSVGKHEKINKRELVNHKED